MDKYEDFFEPELRVRGYRGIFKKKGGGSLDGCALFVKTSKFQLLEEDVQRFHLQDTDSQVSACTRMDVATTMSNFRYRDVLQHFRNNVSSGA